MLADLGSRDKWEEFYKDRAASGSLSEKELGKLREYIDDGRYREAVEGMAEGTFSFSIPEITYISKDSSGKKRIVYRFPAEELWLLKHIAFLLHRYDECFPDACYSFRRGRNAKTAVGKVLSHKGIGKKYCLKADIHDYFNSIPRERLCGKIDGFIRDDHELRDFLLDFLGTDLAREPETGKIVRGNRGAMAGTPLSPFLANLYLTGLDEHFEAKNTLYFRYADDILIFADSAEEIECLKEELFEEIRKEGLTINESKTRVIEPGKPWEFLGIKYDNGVIDISENTKRKTKAKIKRKAHALYRWRIKKGTTFEQTAFVMIRSFNHKFYDTEMSGDFSWSRWFFPLITTDSGLREIDRCLVRYIRYLYKGRHYKGNYRIRYEDLKALGFRSLVAEYYGGKETTGYKR